MWSLCVTLYCVRGHLRGTETGGVHLVKAARQAPQIWITALMPLYISESPNDFESACMLTQCKDATLSGFKTLFMADVLIHSLWWEVKMTEVRVQLVKVKQRQ